MPPTEPRLTSEQYSPWYKAECVIVCGWKGAESANRGFVLASAQRHTHDAGHETALIETASIHYRLVP